MAFEVYADTIPIYQVDFLQSGHDQFIKEEMAIIPMKSSFEGVGLPISRNEEMTGCAVYVLVYMLFFVLLRFRSKNLLYKLFQTIVFRKNAGTLLSDGIVSNSYYYMIALLLSFSGVAFGMSLYLYDSVYWSIIGYWLLGLLGYHLFMLCMVWFLGWCFNRKSLAQEVIANLWALNIVFGILISPLVIATLFMGSYAIGLIYKFVFFIIIIYGLYRIIRWFSILFTNRVSIFYMILYLCALEIVPILILLKSIG